MGKVFPRLVLYKLTKASHIKAVSAEKKSDIRSENILYQSAKAGQHVLMTRDSTNLI